jgi:glycosyltransferase Alg8
MQISRLKHMAYRSFIPVALLYGTIALALLYFIYPQMYLLKGGVIITLSLFALWRYGWMLLNYIRAFIYARFFYPNLKKEAYSLPEEKRYPKYLYFLIPSFKEEPWVTVESFKALLREIKTIPSQVTIVVATASQEEDALILRLFKEERMDKRVVLLFQHQREGKRIAMGHALRTIARRHLKEGCNDSDSVTIFMDGDSYMEPDFLKKLLPFFAADATLGAVTTNELAYIASNDNWYKDWFNLKFGQRHILFQSHALSKKVMTLTGRLSAYRTSIVIEEDFIRQVEFDTITHPLHGKFRFLMGDDKSTWFYLLKHGWKMLYLPDLYCISLESRAGDFLKLSRSLPYRWFGNTLRNNARALALGPQKTGWYIWYAILDQRLVMWTSLVGIVSALILSFVYSFYYLLFFAVWIIFIRLFQLFIIAMGGHPVSWRMLPLILYTQWVGALIKIKAYYNLSDQNWFKGKSNASQKGSERLHIEHPLVRFMPKIAMISSVTLFMTLLLITHGAIAMPELGTLLTLQKPLKELSDERSRGHKRVPPLQIDLKRAGLKPHSRDNAKIINRIIAESDKKRDLLLFLPEGTWDIYEPIVIERDNVTLKGVSSQKTHLHTYLKTPQRAAIMIAGKRGKRLGYTTHNIYQNQTAFVSHMSKEATPFLLLREPNDAAFLKEIGSLRWNRKYPYLRQEIVEVLDVDSYNRKIYTKKPILTDFESGKTEVVALHLCKNIVLQDFSIEEMDRNGTKEPDPKAFVNSRPDMLVDAIALHYAADVKLSNLVIRNSGRHAVNCDYLYHAELSDLSISGSWNKGKKGSGYVRFARTFNSVFRRSKVEKIRHVTLQWSSCGNHLYALDLGVDLNLHGGYSHDNIIDNINFDIPDYHPWKGITTCPKDARWAPPDGKNSIDYKTILYKKEKEREK